MKSFIAVSVALGLIAYVSIVAIVVPGDPCSTWKWSPPLYTSLTGWQDNGHVQCYKGQIVGYR